MSAPVTSISSPNQTIAEDLRQSPYQLPDTVRALSAAVNDLQLAPRAVGTNEIRSNLLDYDTQMFCSRRVSRLHEAAEAISTAVVTSCTRNRLGELPFIAKPALETATVCVSDKTLNKLSSSHSIFTEITRFLQRRARMRSILRFILAVSTRNRIGDHLAAAISLSQILRASGFAHP
ncbi:hypothetical protein BKA62DRAFT_113660 [Auriculariales sp. MPI-PUGE-AT-0066]|nr:hypothetical protein BKA62DRAFT_113660 [Auriculariales sp. MPI-PUGE-AT-0066]